jgi:hypothetical protein
MMSSHLVPSDLARDYVPWVYWVIRKVREFWVRYDFMYVAVTICDGNVRCHGSVTGTGLGRYVAVKLGRLCMRAITRCKKK